MRISKSEILKVINLVKPGIAKKDLVEQATHLIFTKDDIATFNDQVCIIHPFKSEFEFSTKADEFIKIIESIKEPEFELTLEDDNIRIKSKSTNAKRTTVVGETALVTHLIEAVKQAMIGKNFWKPLPKEFTEGLYLCAFSASRDLTTGIRSCCAIKNDGIYTTDNIRISNFIMDSKMDEVLLPAKDAAELVKYAVIEYGISENWAHFKTAEGVIFNCKTLKGDYPFSTLDGIFSDKEVSLKFPEDLKEAVDSITSLAEGESDSDKSITVEIKKGKIIAKAEKERGWITKTIEFDYEGEEFQFLVNPIFFTAVLKHASEFILLEGKLQFQSGNFFHILALPESS